MKISVHFTDNTAHTGTSKDIELDENGSGVWLHYNFNEDGIPRYSKFIPMHRILEIRYEL